MQNIDNTEFEAKFYPVDKEEMRNQLSEIGGELVAPERLMRRQVFNRELNESMKGDYVRIRDEGDKVTMSSKTHARADGEVSDQKEIQIVVSDFQSAVDLLIEAGLTPGDYQENLRETWNVGSAEVVIDTWPSLESYIEIEAESEEKVREVAEKLGRDWDQKIITSVIEIYANKYGVSRDEAHKKIRYSTFDNPPF
jgi:adenylate cyclase class 2